MGVLDRSELGGHPGKDTFGTLRALIAQIQLPGLGEEGAKDVRGLLGAFYALFGAGFLVGVIGHVVRSRLIQAIGIAMVMAGTVLFVVAVGSRG